MSYFASVPEDNHGNLKQVPIDNRGNVKRPRPTVSKNITQNTSGFVSSRISSQTLDAAIEDFSVRLFAAIDAKDAAMAAELATDMNLQFQTARPCWEK